MKDVKISDIIDFINKKYGYDNEISKCPVMIAVFKSIFIVEGKSLIPGELMDQTLYAFEMYVGGVKSSAAYYLKGLDLTHKHNDFNCAIKLFFKRLHFVYSHFTSPIMDLINTNDKLRHNGIKKCMKCYKIFVLTPFYQYSIIKAKSCKTMCPECNFKYNNGIDVVNYVPGDANDHEIRKRIYNNYNKSIKNHYIRRRPYVNPVKVYKEMTTQTDVLMNSSYGTQVTGSDIDKEIKEMLEEISQIPSQKRKRRSHNYRVRNVRSKHI